MATVSNHKLKKTAAKSMKFGIEGIYQKLLDFKHVDAPKIKVTEFR